MIDEAKRCSLEYLNHTGGSIASYLQPHPDALDAVGDVSRNVGAGAGEDLGMVEVD